MSEICPVCGKEFEVLWPSLWSYKRNNQPICSWKCLRTFDKGETDMNKPKQNGQMITCRQLVEAMEAGADPMEWLKEQGYTNPAHAYQNMRNAAKAKDPELFARFPVKKKTRKQEEEQAEDRGLFEKVKEDILQAPAVLVTQMEEEKRTDLWRTTAIRNEELGEFYYDTRLKSLDWRRPYGEEINMPPDVWRKLLYALPGIMMALHLDE